MVSNRRKNIKRNKSNKVKVESIVEPKIEDVEADQSVDDMSEEEMKKMLGSDGESSEELSDETNNQVIDDEAILRKRKISRDEVIKVKKSKTEVSEDEDDVDISEDEDEEEDEEEEYEDDEEDDEENDEKDDDVDMVEKVSSNKKEKKTEIKIEKPEKSTKKEKNESNEGGNAMQKKKNLDKVKKDEKSDNSKSLEDANVKKRIFSDDACHVSGSIKEEIKTRMVDRMKKTLVMVGLGKKFNQEKLKQIFPEFVSCIIPYNTLVHCSTGKAYVDFRTEDEANESYQKIKKEGKIRIFKQSTANCDPACHNCNKLVISNVSNKTTVDELKKIFTLANDILFLKIKFNDRNMTKVAFAFYNCVEDAIAEYDSKHGCELNGNHLNVKFQMKSGSNTTKTLQRNEKRLMVFGIKKKVSDESIKKLFPQAASMQIMRKKGIAAINYETADECKVDKEHATANKLSPHIRIVFDGKPEKSMNKTKKNFKEFAGKNQQSATKSNKKLKKEKTQLKVHIGKNNQAATETNKKLKNDNAQQKVNAGKNNQTTTETVTKLKNEKAQLKDVEIHMKVKQKSGKKKIKKRNDKVIK